MAHKKNGGVAAARVGLKTASTPVTTPVTSKRPAAANGAANGIASVPNAVLERAADAIVFDLVRLDSPLVGATTDLHSANFFDPNSSFGSWHPPLTWTDCFPYIPSIYKSVSIVLSPFYWVYPVFHTLP